MKVISRQVKTLVRQGLVWRSEIRIATSVADATGSPAFIPPANSAQDDKVSTARQNSTGKIISTLLRVHSQQRHKHAAKERVHIDKYIVRAALETHAAKIPLNVSQEDSDVRIRQSLHPCQTIEPTPRHSLFHRNSQCIMEPLGQSKAQKISPMHCYILPWYITFFHSIHTQIIRES